MKTQTCATNEECTHRRACEYMKKFIASTYDIKLFCSNMRIKANGAIYDIKYEKHDLKIRTSKLVRQIREAHTRARYLIKNLIGGSYHIEFSCSNTKFEANGAIYDLKSKKCDFESRGVRHQ